MNFVDKIIPMGQEAAAGASSWPGWWIMAAFLVTLLILLAVMALLIRHRRASSAQTLVIAGYLPNPDHGGSSPSTKAYDGYGGIADHPYGVPLIALAGTTSADLHGVLDSLEPAQIGGERYGDRQFEHNRSRLTRDGIVHLINPELLQLPDWGRRFRRTVQGFASERPTRPLDGLVVAVSVTELQEAMDGRADRLTMLGEQIAELVATIERHGGMRVPLYLLLTGAEHLPGFVAWREALSRHGNDRPIGWAVTGDRAIMGSHRGDQRVTDLLDDALTGLQLELMREQTTDAADLLSFTAALEGLAPPLARLTSACLRQSAYHEAVLWRGFWVSGRNETEAATPLAFCRELFSRKIFREYRLAEPSRRLLGRRGKQIRWAQAGLAATFVLAAIGLLHLTGEEARVASVDRLMGQIDAQIRLADQAPEKDRRSGSGAVRLAALNLLNAMAGVSVASMATPLAPTSFAMGADRKIEMAIGRAYDQVVLSAIGGRLVNMAGELIRLDDKPNSQLPPGEELATLIDRTENYVNELVSFANLRRDGEVGDLAEVADFSLGIHLPNDFSENYHLYGRALAFTRTPELGLTQVRQTLQLTLEGAFSYAAEQFFGATELETAMRDLVKALGSARRHMGDPNSGSAVAMLHAARSAIARIETALSDPLYAWMLDLEQPVGAPFTDLIRRLDDLPTIGPDRLVSTIAQSRLLSTVESIREQSTKRILTYQYSKGLIVNRREGVISLSEPLLLARDEMERIVADMGGAEREVTNLPDGMRQSILWRQGALEQAIALIDRYYEIRLANSNDLPAELKPMLESFAQDRMLSAIGGAIERVGMPRTRLGTPISQQLGNGPDAEEQALAKAAPALIELIANLRRTGMPGLAEELAQTTAAQAVRLLASLDRQLRQAAPYRPDMVGIGLWRGEGSPAPALMGLRSLAQLSSLLPSRRQFIEKLAIGQALPLVQLVVQSGMQHDPISHGLLTRWQGLIDAIDLYQRGDPLSPLMRIEEFLLSDLAVMEATECANMSNPFFDPNDYLALALAQMQETIAERCADIFGENAARRYERIASDFMRTLAGRFPFTGDWSDKQTLARAETASPAAVRMFFLDHGPALKSIRDELLIAPVDLQAAAKAVAFLDQLIVAQQTLSPMLDPRPPARPLRYQIRVGFRTERDFERGGEQIIDWRLSSGEESVSPRRNDRLLPWTAGSDVTLDVRWARNAPDRPAAQANLAGQNRMRWTAQGSWSLLRLIAQLQPLDGNREALTPALLELIVPLEPNPDALAGSAAHLDEARLFVSVELGIEVADGDVVAVQIPHFPSLAPRLRAVIPVSDDITGERGALPLLLPIR